MSNVSNQYGLHADRVALPVLARLALVAARRIQGIQVKVLAKRLGVAPRTLLSWQMGERRPTQSQLSRWWLEVMQQELSGEAHEPIAGHAGVVGGLLVENPATVAQPASCVPVPARRDVDEQRPAIRR